MRLKNFEKVRSGWFHAIEVGKVELVCIRHAEKHPDGPVRCGLSPRGHDQVAAYAAAIQEPMLLLDKIHRHALCSSRTSRNIETALGLIPPKWSRVEFMLPSTLDLPFLGPNDEDFASAGVLAGQLGISRNEAFGLLEEHGVERIGETPEDSHARIHSGLEEILMGQHNFVIYSGNSPTMNEALGVEGVLEELEAHFFWVSGGRFTLFDRIRPQFED